MTPPEKTVTEENKNTFSRDALRDIVRSSTRLMGILWRERRGQMVALAILIILISLIPFAQSGAAALLINRLVQDVGVGTLSGTLLWILAALVLSRIVPPIIQSAQAYRSRIFYFYLEEKFEMLLMKKRADIDLALYENPAYNDLFNNIKENGIWRVQAFSDRQFYVLQNIIELGVAAVIIGFSNPWLLLLILAATIPELIAEVRYGGDVWNIHMGNAEVRRRYWNAQKHFWNTPSLIELKLFQNVAHFTNIIKGLFTRFQKEQIKSDRRRFYLHSSSALLSYGATSVAVVWFVVDTVHGRLQIGTLVFLMTALVQLRESISSFFMNMGRQYQDGLFIRDMFRFLDIEPALDRPAPSQMHVLDDRHTPSIAFENVTFAYPGTIQPVFKNFSLTIPAGEKIAFVGANGAGKTTLIKLICRFYDPDEGRILIDGHDLRTVDIESWYACVGALFQEYDRYYLPVRESIGIGRTALPLTAERVERAAADSESNSFIEEWEGGYSQMLGKEFTGGVEPSVGQWQKLALARTLYRDPRVFILDEPTASIDAEGEAKIFDKLEKLPKDRTVILVSHRFSTVRHASRIAVIKEGRLIEIGSHKELLKKNRVYARLFRLQAKGYE